MKTPFQIFPFVVIYFSSTFLLQGNCQTKSTSSDGKSQSKKFEPTWQSLQKYEAPDWFVMQIWDLGALGPQCQPEQGDWYARHMYDEAATNINGILPTMDILQSSFKESSMTGKQRSGILKNSSHFINVPVLSIFCAGQSPRQSDLWNSKYQEWNTTRVGPKKDIISSWQQQRKKTICHSG